MRSGLRIALSLAFAFVLAALPPQLLGGTPAFGSEGGEPPLAAAPSAGNLGSGSADDALDVNPQSEGGEVAYQEVGDWAALESALNTDGSYRLSRDIEAGAADGPLSVPSGTTVVLDLNGKTLKRASQSLADYGVITNAGTLTITDGAGGGAITGGYTRANGGGVSNSGNLTIAGGTIAGNYTYRDGGGVYNAGTLTISGGSIAGNEANGNGGGVRNEGTMAIAGGSITGNDADSEGGGGIDNAGALAVSGNPVVADNKVLPTGSVRKNVYLRASGPTIKVAGALEDGASLYVSSEGGTGIFTSGYKGHGSADPQECFHPDAAGTGVMLVDGEACLGSAPASWAALQSTIKNSTGRTFVALGQTLKAASNESAIQIPSGKDVVLDLRGHDLDRGLSKEGSAGHVIQMKGSSKLTVVNSSEAVGRITGGWSEHGGGINVEEKSTCIVEGGRVEGNHADYGGGIYNAGTLVVSGGDVSSNEASEEGGGIYGKGTTRLSDCTIWGNAADYGAGVYFDKKPNEQTLANVTVGGNTAGTKGAAIYLQTGSVTMTGGAVRENVSFDGAGVYVTDNTEFRADGTSFTSNTVTYRNADGDPIGKSGGALVNHGTATLKSCTVEENTADKDGGAIWSDENLTLLSTTVAKNTLTMGKGAGIYVKSGTARLEGCTISGNVNGKNYRTDEICDGGGIANNGTLTVASSRIEGNTARNDGGGIYNTGSLQVYGARQSYITNNIASNGQGGGVCAKSGTAEFALAVITGNRAKLVGGGISCDEDGKLVFWQTNEIRDNKTGTADAVVGEGGGVYMDGKMTASGALIIKDNLGAYGGYDLFLTSGKVINVGSSSLSAKTEIGVGTPTGTGVITKSYDDQYGYNPASKWFFVSGPMSEICSVRTNEDGQAELCIDETRTVSYYDPLEKATKVKPIKDVKLITGETTTLKSGWYYFVGEMEATDRIEVDGKANIILTDDVTLSVLSGIVVEGSDALTIWGQDQGTGKLKATNWGNNAAIGSRSGKKAGTMTFNGGVVEAVSGYGAAAIGAGTKANGGTVVINYGSVSAIADGPGAGIGCGAYIDYVNPREPRSNIENGGTVIINGGTVYAAHVERGDGGAGIGGGEYCDGANVTITGGNVTAIGGSLGGAGIGGGYWSEGRTCTITGGHVTATSKNVYGVGNGAYVRSKGTAKTILDYNDTDMSFTASSYSAGDYKRGTLTFVKPFKNADNPSQIYGAAKDLDSEDYKLIYSLAGVTLVPAPDAHTVTFDSDGADKVTPQGVEDGGCAKEPAKPSKKGFRFIGWRLVEGGKMSPTNFDFSTPITGDVLLRAFYIDEKEHGADRYAIETRPGAPAIDALNMPDVVGVTLTQAELDAGGSLLLVSSPLAKAKVPSGDRAALESRAKGLGATPGTWFDVSLYKVLGGRQAKISKAGCPAQITVKVPASLRKDGRTFYLLGLRGGKAKVVAEGAGAALEGVTGEFSTFLIAYGKLPALAKGSTAEAADRAIKAMRSDEDPAGTAFAPLRLRVSKVSKATAALSWKKAEGAARYVVYGGKGGKGGRMAKVATAKGPGAVARGLAKGAAYKFIVVALDKGGKVVSASKVVHAYTKGGKRGNPRSVAVAKKARAKAKRLGVGETVKLSAKARGAKGAGIEGVAAVRYESSDPGVATVSARGVVEARAKGGCHVYAYARNGVAKKVKVTVR